MTKMNQIPYHPVQYYTSTVLHLPFSNRNGKMTKEESKILHDFLVHAFKQVDSEIHGTITTLPTNESTTTMSSARLYLIKPENPNLPCYWVPAIDEAHAKQKQPGTLIKVDNRELSRFWTWDNTKIDHNKVSLSK